MSYCEVTGLSHAFGDKILYTDASFTLLKGEHMGVVGQNGAGKSTLIQILSGELIPDQGDVRWQRGLRIGLLTQYAEVNGGHTVLQYLQTAFAPQYAMEARLQTLYAQAAEGGASTDPALAEAAALQERLEASGFYTVDSQISRVAAGLGLTAFGMDSPLGELSGGQRAKVILAKLLLEQADVLLLDEPTNFLDKEHVSWLAEYLRSFAGAFLAVSHDYAFLEQISGCILDIEFTSIRKYHGKYSDFLRQKTHLREDYIRRFSSQQKQIAQTEAYILKNKAGVNAKMARGRQKQLDRLERLAPPAFAVKPVIRFSELPLSSPSALSAEGLEVGYGAPLLPALDLHLACGQKIAVTGFNGIGKSTLLKTLVGELPPLAGRVCYADGVRIGYYAQELTWEDDSKTPLQMIADAYPDKKEKDIRRHLAQCGVRADNLRQAVATLSGGEQSKVKLCRLLLSPCNFLLLDEPTNHLDAETKAALREALIGFAGCVILVSHEEAFYQGWVDSVFHIERLFD